MNDSELIDGLRRRDPDAIKEMMQTHGDRLYRSAYLLSGSHEADAKDLVQDALVQAVRSAPSFLGKSSLYTWLHGILINVHRNAVRKKGRLRYTQNIPEPEAAPAPAHDEEPGADISPEALTQALQQLSPDHREVILLYYFNNMTVPEIARHAGLSLGTAKSRLFYAVRELRRVLRKK